MTPVSEAFEPLHRALKAASVRFAIGGSWASAAYGEPRLTNVVDLVADLTPQNLDRFLAELPPAFLADPEEARLSLRLGRPFNVIYMPMAFKFDLFPARAFPLGIQEIARAVELADNGLSEAPLPFVTPEDILLAKLHWFKAGGEVSTIQWRDIEGIVRSLGTTLDPEYLAVSAEQLDIAPLLERALDRP